MQDPNRTLLNVSNDLFVEPNRICLINKDFFTKIKKEVAI